MAISSRANDTIYALYTGYDKDRNSDYDFVIGVRVVTTDSVPPGMVLKHVPSGKYAVITSGKGPAFQVVPGAWQQVWKLEDDAQLGGTRAYSTDYEIYDQRARDPQAVQVDLFISVQ